MILWFMTPTRNLQKAFNLFIAVLNNLGKQYISYPAYKWKVVIYVSLERKANYVISYVK